MIPRSIEQLDEHSLRSSLYFARDGTPIPFSTWAALIEYGDAQRGQGSYRTVRKTKIAGAAVEVSTVWLGLDYGHGFGPPLIFESMVFYEHEPRTLAFGYVSEREGGYTERYASEEEARSGHRRIVRALQDGRPLAV